MKRWRITVSLVAVVSILFLSSQLTAMINTEIRAAVMATGLFKQSPILTLNQIVNFPSTMRENELLRSQLQQRRLDLEVSQVDLESVPVLTPEATAHHGYIYIAAGSLMGLEPGDLVHVGEVFVGQVDSVALNYSRVELVTNANSSWTVTVGGDNLAMAVGEFNLAVKIDELDGAARVQAGDQVRLVSNDRDPLLNLYQIGVLQQRVSDERAAIQEWDIDYPVAISSLEQVGVMRQQ